MGLGLVLAGSARLGEFETSSMDQLKTLKLFYAGSSVVVKFSASTSREELLSGICEALGLAPSSPLRFRDADGLVCSCILFVAGNAVVVVVASRLATTFVVAFNSRPTGRAIVIFSPALPSLLELHVAVESGFPPAVRELLLLCEPERILPFAVDSDVMRALCVSPLRSADYVICGISSQQQRVVAH